MGFVYLIWAKGTNSFKIGKTENIGNCLQNRQTYSRHVLELAAYKEVQDFSEEEKRLKLKWSEFNVHGEWFDIPINEIPSFLGDFAQVKNEVTKEEHSLTQDYFNVFLVTLEACRLSMEEEGYVFDSADVQRLLMDINDKTVTEFEEHSGHLQFTDQSLYGLIEYLADLVERRTGKITRMKTLKERLIVPKVKYVSPTAMW